MPVKGLRFKVYHEAIVYDRGDGSKPAVIQARPSIEYNGSAAQEAWLKDELPQFLEEPAAGVAKSPFGTILAEETKFNRDWNGPGIVSRLAFSGEDLSAKWSDIQRTMHDVNWLGLSYLPVRQNSNSFASSALRNAGISPPVPMGATVPNGFMTHLWAPAANNPLRVLQDRTVSLLREFQKFQSQARQMEVPGHPAEIGEWRSSPKYTDDIGTPSSVFETGTEAIPFVSSDGPGRLSGLVDRRTKAITSTGLGPRLDSSGPGQSASDFYGGSKGEGDDGPVRYLTRRIGASPKLLQGDTQVTDAMRSPERAFSSGRPATFDDRFANWTDAGGTIAPLAPDRAVPPAEDNRPRGILSGEPMPVYPVPPPIFGFPEAGEPDDENRLALLLGPRRAK